MFVDQARAPARIASRRDGAGADQNLDLPGFGDAEHAEAETAAQIAKTRVALAALAAVRQPRRQPDLVAGAGAVNALKDEFEIEGEFQLADHHDRRIVGAKGDKVAAADFSFDGEAKAFEKAFDRQIERGFQAAISCALPYGKGRIEQRRKACLRLFPAAENPQTGLVQPFTAPAVRPATMYFCASTNTTTAGNMVSVMKARTNCQAVEYSP
jgi:hypothetical protein